MIHGGAVFEISSKGIRVSRAILDRQTGEVLLEKDRWHTPTWPDLERFTWAVEHNGPGASEQWELRYLNDLMAIVLLMKAWLKKWGPQAPERMNHEEESITSDPLDGS